MRLVEVLKNAFKVKDLRKKIGMTLLLIIIFRIGCFITVPGLQDAALDSLAGNGLFKFMDMLSGGAFQQVSIFSLGISPYINASIIMQLLTVAIPYLEKKQKDPFFRCVYYGGHFAFRFDSREFRQSRKGCHLQRDQRADRGNGEREEGTGSPNQGIKKAAVQQ